MYEKVVNYYEENLCIDNIFFRRNYKKWIIGMIVLIVLEILVNYLITALINNLWIRTLIQLMVNIVIAISFLILIYIPPLIKIYREKVKVKTKIDIIGLLMNQEKLGEYRKIEIEDIEKFLKKECKIKDTKSIDMIIEEIDKEIKSKYEQKSFMEKYFNNMILPLLILVLTVYFTNNNEQQLVQIISKTIIAVLSIIIAGNFLFKIKNAKLIPVDKKQNLLELKRVLVDIKIKWSK